MGKEGIMHNLLGRGKVDRETESNVDTLLADMRGGCDWLAAGLIAGMWTGPGRESIMTQTVIET